MIEQQKPSSEAEQLIAKVKQLQNSVEDANGTKAKPTAETTGEAAELTAKIEEIGKRLGTDNNPETQTDVDKTYPQKQQTQVLQTENELLEQLIPKTNAQNGAQTVANSGTDAQGIEQSIKNGAQNTNTDIMLQNMDALGENIAAQGGLYEGSNNKGKTLSVKEILKLPPDERVTERYKARIDALKAYKQGGWESLDEAQRKVIGKLNELGLDMSPKGIDKTIAKYEKELYGNNPLQLKSSQDDGIINTDNTNGGNIYADRMGEKGENSGGSEGVRGASEDLHIGRSGERTYDVGRKYSDGSHTVLHRDVLSEDDFAEAVKRQGADPIKLYDVSDNYDGFSKALAEGKASNPNGYMVDGKSVQELEESGAKCFLTEDGSAGVLVTKDGDIEGVFKNSKTSKAKKAVYPLLLTAVANGGNKLDCYGINLVKFYNGNGFEAVGRVEYVYGFNPEMDEAIKKDIASGKLQKEPGVYAMKLRDNVDANTVASKMGLSEEDGGFHRQTQEELDALPLYEGENSYDEMLSARDALLEKGKDNKTGKADTDSIGSFNAENSEIKAIDEESSRHSESGASSMRDMQTRNSIREQNTEMRSVPGRDSEGNSDNAGRPQTPASGGQRDSIRTGNEIKQKEADAESTGSFNAQNSKEGEHPNTVGAMQSNTKGYSHAQNTFGTYPEGENASRVVDVPVSMDGKTKVNRFNRTEQEAAVTPDNLIKHFEKATEKGLFNYDIKTDNESIEKAKNKIIKKGFEKSVGEFTGLVEGSRRIGKDELVFGEMLYAHAAQTGDTKTAMELASSLAQEFTKAGQAVQAARILKTLSPEGRLYNAQQIVNKLNNCFPS